MKRGLIDKRTISSDDPWLPEYMNLIGQTVGGIKITSAETAMKIATVYRSVAILSGTIASLPLYPRRKIDDYFAIDYGNPLYTLLKWKSSSRLNAYQTMESVIVQILMDGNSYLFPKYSNGDIYELVLLKQGSVVYNILNDTYMINDYENQIYGTFDSWRIIHLRNKNLDGSKVGISTIQYASRILNISANADEQTLSNMKSGNKQKGFLTGGSVMDGMGKIKDNQVDTVAKRLEDQLANGDSVMRLPGELSWQPYTISPADAQILDNRRFSVFDICRFYGVHPDKVFVEQSSNYKASENSQTSFMTDTLQPLLAQIEIEFSTKLISKKLVGRKEKIEFDREALYQIDPVGMAKWHKIEIETGSLMPNESRILKNRKPIEGGNIQLVSANLVPINSDKIWGRKTDTKTNKIDEVKTT